METWYTWVRAADGTVFQVSCQANSCGKAKMIFESTYGKANVIHLPSSSS